MRGVELPPVDRPPHTSGMGYAADEGVWEIGCAGGDFAVRGGPDAPDPARLDLAWRAAARIDALAAEANAYLAAFVVPERFGAAGPWEWVGADFGRDPAAPADAIDLLLFLEGDGYGMWWVRFRFAGPQLPRFFPNQFGRRQM